MENTFWSSPNATDNFQNETLKEKKRKYDKWKFVFAHHAKTFYFSIRKNKHGCKMIGKTTKTSWHIHKFYKICFYWSFAENSAFVMWFEWRICYYTFSTYSENFIFNLSMLDILIQDSKTHIVWLF